MGIRVYSLLWVMQDLYHHRMSFLVLPFAFPDLDFEALGSEGLKLKPSGCCTVV